MHGGVDPPKLRTRWQSVGNAGCKRQEAHGYLVNVELEKVRIRQIVQVHAEV